MLNFPCICASWLPVCECHSNWWATEWQASRSATPPFFSQPGACQCQFAQSNCNFLLTEMQQKERRAAWRAWVTLAQLNKYCSLDSRIPACAAGALLDLGAHIFCIHSPLSGITLCTHTHTRTPLPIHSLTHSFIFLGFGSAPLSCWQVQYAARHTLLHPYNIHTHNPPTIHPLTEWLCQLVAFRISSVRVHHFRYFPSTFHSSASCSPLYPHWPLFLFCFTAPI